MNIAIIAKNIQAGYIIDFINGFVAFMQKDIGNYSCI